MKRSVLIAALAAALFSVPAQAAKFSEVVSFAVGANAAWLHGPDAGWAVEPEVGGGAHASLSPHISLVGGAYYGLTESYLRWAGGVRVTATDVDNRNFNVFIGLRRRGGSEASVRPDEWEADAGFGWRPSPEAFPRIVLGVDSGVGLKSNRSLTVAAIRYTF